MIPDAYTKHRLEWIKFTPRPLRPWYERAWIKFMHTITEVGPG